MCSFRDRDVFVECVLSRSGTHFINQVDTFTWHDPRILWATQTYLFGKDRRIYLVNEPRSFGKGRIHLASGTPSLYQCDALFSHLDSIVCDWTDSFDDLISNIWRGHALIWQRDALIWQTEWIQMAMSRRRSFIDWNAFNPMGSGYEPPHFEIGHLHIISGLFGQILLILFAERLQYLILVFSDHPPMFHLFSSS